MKGSVVRETLTKRVDEVGEKVDDVGVEVGEVKAELKEVHDDTTHQRSAASRAASGHVASSRACDRPADARADTCGASRSRAKPLEARLPEHGESRRDDGGAAGRSSRPRSVRHRFTSAKTTKLPDDSTAGEMRSRPRRRPEDGRATAAATAAHMPGKRDRRRHVAIRPYKYRYQARAPPASSSADRAAVERGVVELGETGGRRRAGAASARTGAGAGGGGGASATAAAWRHADARRARREARVAPRRPRRMSRRRRAPRRAARVERRGRTARGDGRCPRREAMVVVVAAAAARRASR